MAASLGPNIIDNSLILGLDAADAISCPRPFTAPSTWYDLSINAKNATLSSATSFDSNNGGSILLDSVNDYANLPSSGLAFGSGAFTIESWCYLTTALTNNVIYYSQSSNTSGFSGFGYTNGSGFFLTDFNGSVRVTTINTTSISLNTWYYVVGVRNASNQYVVYVNGIASTTNNTSSLALTTLDPRIGTNPASNGERWTGRIAILRMYNRTLSATEILQNFNATRKRFNL